MIRCVKQVAWHSTKGPWKLNLVLEKSMKKVSIFCTNHGKANWIVSPTRELWNQCSEDRPFIDNWYGETLCLCTWSMCLNLNFNYFAHAECFVWNFVTRDQRNISRSTDEAVVTAKLVLWIEKCVKSILIWIFLSSANEVNLSPLI